jgi:hypothetical protein
MRKLIIVLTAAAWCAAAHAEAPSDESIATLLEAARSERTLEAVHAYMGTAIRQGIKAGLKGRTLTDEQQAAVERMASNVEQSFREELSWDKMRPLMIQIYRDTFTQGEIDGLIAFYRSPSGAAFVDKMPQVLQKTQTLMQARMGPLTEKMNAAVAQAIQEVKEAGAKPRTSGM